MENLYCDLCNWIGKPKDAKYINDFNGDTVLTCPKECHVNDFNSELQVMNTINEEGNKLLWYEHESIKEYIKSRT